MRSGQIVRRSRAQGDDGGLGRVVATLLSGNLHLSADRQNVPREDALISRLLRAGIPDGVRIRVLYRARARHPEPGLHASVLSLPGMPVDPRPVDQIVAEAFATPPAG